VYEAYKAGLKSMGRGPASIGDDHEQFEADYWGGGGNLTRSENRMKLGNLLPQTGISVSIPTKERRASGILGVAPVRIVRAMGGLKTDIEPDGSNIHVQTLGTDRGNRPWTRLSHAVSGD